MLVFYPAQNNLEHGGGGPEHGESSQYTSSENVYLFGSIDNISDNYEPALSSQSAGPAHVGEADGDEYTVTLQQQLLVEDEDGLADDLDSDNENDGDDQDDEEDVDDVPIPDSWNEDKSNMTVVEDGNSSSWEYHMNNFQVGAQYSTKQQLREAVIKWALSTQRVFRTEVSNKKYLTMSCVDINCPGRVHGHLPKYDVMWVVSGFEPHTCEISKTLDRKSVV